MIVSKKNKEKVRLDVYICLMIMYELSSNIFGHGLIVTILRWTLFATSLIYSVALIAEKKKVPFFITSLAMLYFVFFMYGIAIVIQGKVFYVWRVDGRRVRSFVYLLQISESLLPVFVFYYYSRINALTDEYIRKRVIIFLIVAAICYAIGLQKSILQTGHDEVTNNSGYLILSLFPLFLIFRPGSWKQYLSICGSMILIGLSMKRGAILLSFVSLFVFFSYLLMHAKRSTKVGVIVLLIMMIIGTYIGYGKMMSSSVYFQQRVEKTIDGNTSGRDYIFDYFINTFLHKTTESELLFGQGANATLEIYGQYAHNDWIEIAINQGIFGLVVYLVYWMAFFILCVKKQMDPCVRAILVMIFIIYFFKTIFSMSYRTYSIYVSMMLGYAIAKAFQSNKTIDENYTENH